MLRRRKIPGRKKVGLALGSGSARGWAHIGVIRALNEAGIKAKFVAGTSIGAFVGAFYASGRMKNIEDFTSLLTKRQVFTMLDLVFPRSGLLDGDKVSEFFAEQIGPKMMEDLEIPFSTVSTDLDSGEEVVISRGDILDAVRASLSIPGVFTPVMLNGRMLVDGGLTNPVPVDVVREMGADFVIAVDVNSSIFSNNAKDEVAKERSAVTWSKRSETFGAVKLFEDKIRKFAQEKESSLFKGWRKKEKLPGILDVISTSMNIIEVQLTRMRLAIDPPDMLITPDVGDIGFAEFHRAYEAMEAGYRAAEKALDSM